MGIRWSRAQWPALLVSKPIEQQPLAAEVTGFLPSSGLPPSSPVGPGRIGRCQFILEYCHVVAHLYAA
jgi:hypothetical protein